MTANALEEEFFRKQEAALLNQLRAAQTKESAQEALAAATGVRDSAVLHKLNTLGITSDTLLALGLVPLVAIAWADGALDDKERRAITASLDTAGIVADSPASQLVQSWLSSPPPASMLEAWLSYTAALAAALSPTERNNLRDSVLGRACRCRSGGRLPRVRQPRLESRGRVAPEVRKCLWG